MEEDIRDTPHLLSIFPEEVWNFILAHVDNASDYYKICAASPLFQGLLSSRRTQALFGNVAEILAQTCASWKRAGIAERVHANNGGIGPDVGNNGDAIDFQDFAPLRRVCRAWKNGVDCALQNLPCHQRRFPEERMTLEACSFMTVDTHYTTKFANLDHFDKFGAHFKPTHQTTGANPFPTRSVNINIPGTRDGAAPRYEEAYFKVFRSYGTHIWYLSVRANVTSSSQKLYFYNRHNDQLQLMPTFQAYFYNRLKDMLHLLPNLRVLQCYIQGNETTMPILFPKNVSEDILRSYRAVPFPVLQNLTVIDQVGMPLPLFVEQMQENLPNLEKFGVDLNTEQDFRAFCELRLPVSKLRLDLHNLSVCWGVIFSALEYNFGKTLTELHIWLPKKDANFFCGSPLKLQNLKRLHLKLENPVPMDFLLQMANNLEELDIRLRSLNLEGLAQVVRLERQLRFWKALPAHLRRCNIWEQIPGLTKVRVWRRYEEAFIPSWSCSRQQWNMPYEIFGNPELQQRELLRLVD